MPAVVPARGSRRLLIIPAAADILAITLTEAAAGDDISCYLDGPNAIDHTDEVGVIEQNPYCSNVTLQLDGVEKPTLNVEYTLNLNSPTDDVARLALPQGTTGIAVHLTQIDQDEFTYAADDWYQAIRFQASKPMLVKTKDNRPDPIRQRLNARSKWTPLSQLVAGS